MNEVSIEALPALYAKVVWLAFGLSFIFGAVAQRTHFCTMGAIADLVNFGQDTRLRQWLLAIGVAVIGTQSLAALGLIDTTQTVFASPRVTWFAYLVGGLFFGFGMVLTGGCGNRTLVRLGAGSLKSLIVFIVLGLSAYVTLRGALALVRVYGLETVSVQLNSAQDLPSILAHAFDLAKTQVHWLLGLGVGGLLMVYALWQRDFWTLDNLLAGFVMGGVIVALWYVSGHMGYLAEHPETLEATYVRTNSGRMESLSFVAPMAYTLEWLMFYSDISKVVTLGIAAVFGIVLGSAAMALVTKQFRWEGFANTEDTANHLVGATFMGFGGILALGCTIGQGLSGLSTLSISSLIAVTGICIGAVLALKYQMWRVEHMD